jgi:hypothetical protein
MTDTEAAFSSEELDGVQKNLPGISGSQQARFVQECIQYYRGWYGAHRDRISRGEIQADQALIIILSESPELSLKALVSSDAGASRSYRKSFSLESGLAIATENFRKILKSDITFSNADKLFEFVISNVNQDDVFVILFPSQKRLLVHMENEDLEEWIDNPYEETINVVEEDVTPESVLKQIEIFHERATRTPLCWAARRMWVVGDSSVKLCEFPENMVQSFMLTHFSAWVSRDSAPAQVLEEINNPGGRLDILISRTSQNLNQSLIYKLELKVLNPSKNPKYNQDWALSGVTQANDYRDKTSSVDSCFACIFDARINKKAIVGLEEKASELDVKLSFNIMDVPEPKNKKKVQKRSSA